MQLKSALPILRFLENRGRCRNNYSSGIPKETMTMKKTKFVLAIAAALTLSACADMKATPAPIVADGRIATADGMLADAVRFELNAMGVRGLTVTSANSEITLKGDVETGRDLARIAKAVQAVPGVRAVIPDINVKR
ncbi:MAG: BON domain-containing protein [Usitatibacteraceae bacterium]|jgi:hypothetical protein